MGVARIREITQQAAERLANSGRRHGACSWDEIHRFSRSQQDVLLADVERGLITLIGATTENPLFAVNSALVSRSTLFRLEPPQHGGHQAGSPARHRRPLSAGYGKLDLRVSEEALDVWAVKCDGDARRALTAPRGGGAVEPGWSGWGWGGGGKGGRRTLSIGRPPRSRSSRRRRCIRTTGTSITIRSARSSSRCAGRIRTPRLYWLARMIDAGEDPRFHRAPPGDPGE